MGRLLNHSDLLITEEWLKEAADRIEKGKELSEEYRLAHGINRPIKLKGWAIFEVEFEKDDGFLELRVDIPEASGDCVAMEIHTGVACSDYEGGWSRECVGIGLYKYRDDVLALLEILARGSHGFLKVGR